MNNSSAARLFIKKVKIRSDYLLKDINEIPNYIREGK